MKAQPIRQLEIAEEVIQEGMEKNETMNWMARDLKNRLIEEEFDGIGVEAAKMLLETASVRVGYRPGMPERHQIMFRQPE